MPRLAALALVVAVATTATLCSAISPAGALSPDPIAVQYRPPVDAPVIDRFRPPATPYGPGNVGIDYATPPGTAVAAAAAGQVVFAGQVGGRLHVVVLHGDGIRTSSSFLASIAVHRGQQVAAGAILGTTGTSLHFGARAGEAYLDPLVLLGSGAGLVAVHLVPDTDRRMGSVGSERSGLRRLLGAVPGAVVSVGGTAVGWARDGLVAGGTLAVDTVDEARQLVATIVPFTAAPWRMASGMAEWWDNRDRCTAAGVIPPKPIERRRVVLVAGLGSAWDDGGVFEVDTAALGYARSDVLEFSYAGGTTHEAHYGPADTQGDLRESGRRLRELLERLVAEQPGVPIDVIAHSQGGLVARSALGSRAPPGVENLITLATPHYGADAATMLALVALTPKGAVAEKMLARLPLSDIDPTSTSVRQLSQTSPFLRELNSHPLPEGVRVTSIAGRADLAVPAPRAHLAGATNVVVTVPDVLEHGVVPSTPEATREMALALAGMAPSCEGFFEAVADLVVGETISAAEDAAGTAIWVLVQ